MSNAISENSLTIPIIGYHRSALSQKFGIPRQPNLVALTSVIEFVAPYDMLEAFTGIEAFSHLWVTWQTHHNHLNNSDLQTDIFKPRVRPPRLGGNKKLGVFATRSTYRPSQLGLSVVRLQHVEVVKGKVRLHISGADMVDGTPIIDVKPYLAYSDCIVDAACGFAPTKPTLKTVKVSDIAQIQFEQIIAKQAANKYSDLGLMTATESLIQADVDIICQLIAQDPRPAYKQPDTERSYFMRYKNFDIEFTMQHDTKNDTDLLLIVSVFDVN